MEQRKRGIKCWWTKHGFMPMGSKLQILACWVVEAWPYISSEARGASVEIGTTPRNETFPWGSQHRCLSTGSIVFATDIVVPWDILGMMRLDTPGSGIVDRDFRFDLRMNGKGRIPLICFCPSSNVLIRCPDPATFTSPPRRAVFAMNSSILTASTYGLIAAALDFGCSTTVTTLSQLLLLIWRLPLSLV